MKKIFLPKVQFLLPSADQDGHILWNFIHPRPAGWDWSERVFKVHPKLKIMVAGVKDNKKLLLICQKYAREVIKKNQKNLQKMKVDFQKDWDKVGNKYLKILSQHFETDWPADKKIMNAFISICPICPRDLDHWSFRVNCNDPKSMRRTAFHEIIHFLYFKKWREVFPKTKRRELDSPYLVWKLSEIIVYSILDYHPGIQELVDTRSSGYTEFQNVKVGKRMLVPYVNELYINHLRSKKSFADFLKLIWKETLKYRKVIEKI